MIGVMGGIYVKKLSKPLCHTEALANLDYNRRIRQAEDA